MWVQSRHTDEGKQANGWIFDIDWESETIQVKFHDDRVPVEYNFDDFEGNWTSKFGGCWLVEKLFLSPGGTDEGS